MTMSKYRVNENLVKKSTRELFIAYAPFGLILSALIVVPVLVLLNDGRIGSWTIAVPFFLLVFGLQMVRLIRRQQALMKSYFLEITGAGINRWIKGDPPLSIEPMEIISIFKFKNGGFLVKGQDGKQIMIPQMLDGPGNLEQQLLALGPISTRPLWFHVILLGVGLFLALIKLVPDPTQPPAKSNRSANNPSSNLPPIPAAAPRLSANTPGTPA